MRHSSRLWPAAIALALFSTSVSAVVVGDKDWQTFNEFYGLGSGALFDAMFDSTTGQCDVAVCKVGGVDMTEYVWASTADVMSLFQAYGFQLSSLTTDNLTAFSGSGSPIGNFFDDIGSTNSGTVGCGSGPCLAERIVALTRDQTSADTRDLIYLVGYSSAVDPTADYVGLSISFGNDSTLFSPGAPIGSGAPRGWFYKPTEVPEPGTVALLGLGLAGLGLSRRRKT